MNWTEVTDISIDMPTMEKIPSVVIGIVYLAFQFQSTLLFLLHYTVEHNVIKALAFIILTYWLSGPPPGVCIGVSDAFLGVPPL